MARTRIKNGLLWTATRSVLIEGSDRDGKSMRETWCDEALVPYWVSWAELDSRVLAYATDLDYPPRRLVLTRNPRVAGSQAWIEARDRFGKVFMLELTKVDEDPDSFAQQPPGAGIHDRRKKT